MNSKNIIRSLNNSQVKHLIMLQTKSKTRNDQLEFIIEGIKLYEEAKEDGVIVKTYYSETFYRETNKEHDYEKIEHNEFDYEIIKDSIFKEISDTISPQGIMAIVKMPKNDISDIIGNDNKNKVKIMLLEDIRDPGNLGTIIRTAEG
ncbi:MAG TPA: 23S rRNA (guanosine(2251)-2'-O)-methyltransferase RlmB, partial [Clostridiales bacterium]|nr:23S rRNA (guanosine(2251)-2'-O)-methyltransferase RlmB [Clostridiales bacterium]